MLHWVLQIPRYILDIIGDLASPYKQHLGKIPENKKIRLQHEIKSDQHIRRLAEKMTGRDEMFDLFDLDTHDFHDIQYGVNRDGPILQR